MRVNLRDVAIAAARDPKQAIYDAIGDYRGIEVFHNEVMVGTYVPPERIMKGPNGEDIVFYTTDKNKDEHRFQGKVGLVLEVGPNAFKDDAIATFGGMKIEPGDWVFFRTSDGWEFFLGEKQAETGHSVRIISDTLIKGRVPDPSMIY